MATKSGRVGQPKTYRFDLDDGDTIVHIKARSPEEAREKMDSVLAKAEAVRFWAEMGISYDKIRQYVEDLDDE